MLTYTVDPLFFGRPKTKKSGKNMLAAKEVSGQRNEDKKSFEKNELSAKEVSDQRNED